MVVRAGSSPLAPFLLLLALGGFLASGLIKAVLLAKNKPEPAAVPPAVAAAEAAAGPAGPAAGVKDFLKKVRLSGSVGGAGWTGAATYGPLRLGASGAGGALKEVEAAAGFKGKGLRPDSELVAKFAPGSKSKKVSYAARFTKSLPKGPNHPSITATLTHAGATLGAAMAKPVTKDVDVSVNVQLPLSYASGRVDPTLNAQAVYKVGNNGKVVGNLAAKASSGLRGAALSANYDLGF